MTVPGSLSPLQQAYATEPSGIYDQLPQDTALVSSDWRPSGASEKPEAWSSYPGISQQRHFPTEMDDLQEVEMELSGEEDEAEQKRTKWSTDPVSWIKIVKIWTSYSSDELFCVVSSAKFFAGCNFISFPKQWVEERLFC